MDDDDDNAEADGPDGVDDPVITFTGVQADTYFMESGDKVRMFYEENVFDDDGQLRVPKEQAINKIGHGAVLCIRAPSAPPICAPSSRAFLCLCVFLKRTSQHCSNCFSQRDPLSASCV